MVTFTGMHYANPSQHRNIDLSDYTIVPVLPIGEGAEWIDASEPSLAGISKMARKYRGCSIMVTEHQAYAIDLGSPKIAFEECMKHLEADILHN